MIKEGQIYREAFFFSQGYNKAQKSLSKDKGVR